VLEQTQGLHLQAKFHLNVFIVSVSGGQKPQFLANFDILGGSCTDPLLPMRAKMGVCLGQPGHTGTRKVEQMWILKGNSTLRNISPKTNVYDK